jgi:hypothetical protein
VIFFIILKAEGNFRNVTLLLFRILQNYYLTKIACFTSCRLCKRSYPITCHEDMQGYTVIALPFNFGTRMRWVFNATPRPRYTAKANLHEPWWQLSRCRDSLWTAQSWDRILLGAKFSPTIQTGTWAHPAFCTKRYRISFPGAVILGSLLCFPW